MNTKYKGLKVLFFTKLVPDYLYDILYAGFRELGCVVEEYPEKKNLHSFLPSCPPQLKFNYDREILVEPPDLMIIGAHGYSGFNDEDINKWANKVQDVYRVYKPKDVIIIDGSDHMMPRYPVLEVDYKAIFKRELVTPPYSNWYNLSFCARPEPFYYRPFEEREIDISYMVSSPSNPVDRIKIGNFLKEYCEKLGLRSFIHVSDKMLDRDTYLGILSNSRASVSVKGLGWDCYRYWEIAARGTILISDRSPLYIPDDFNHIFKFSSEKELFNILEYIKDAEPENLEIMALKTLHDTATYHTPKKRALYVLDKTYS